MLKKRNIYFKSTIYLIIGGFITRSLGFIIKIIYSRILKDEGIGLLTIVMPTYSILLTITSLALPIALSKLVAENKKRFVKLMSNSTIIVLIVNFLVIILMIIFSDFIANNLLHEPRCKGLLIAMSFTFPFVSASSIIKGYFNGKQRTLPYMISNVLEQLLRLIIIIIVIPILYQKSVYLAVKGLLLMSIISEIFSIVVFMFFIPKNVKIDLKTLKPDFETQKDILNIAIPTVSGRVIGNIGYFLEPIILTNLLLLMGYSNEYIIMEYGFYNAYSLSLLTMPLFFIAAISNTIIPEISKYRELRNDFMVKRRIKQSLLSVFLVGVFFSIIIIIFRIPLLKLLYNTTNGANYILILAPFFALFYLESVLYSVLQASGFAKKAMTISLNGVIVKLLSMSLLCLLKTGMYSLVIAEIINILTVVFLNFKTIKKEKLI
mgnify:CR=1 FL=1